MNKVARMVDAIKEVVSAHAAFANAVDAAFEAVQYAVDEAIEEAEFEDEDE